MIIKTPSGKTVAYTVGKSVLQFVGAKGSIIGTDYSIRLENPENPSDSITIAVEKGEFILENIEEDDKSNTKPNGEGDGSGGEEPIKSDDKNKGETETPKPPVSEEGGDGGKSENGGESGKKEGDEDNGGKSGEGDGGEDPNKIVIPDPSRKWTKH